MTQYKYRDHAFSDTLKPATAENKLRSVASKKAWVRSDGRVVISEKSKSDLDISMPKIESQHSQILGTLAEPKNSRQQLKSGSKVEKSMRKVHSANMVGNISKNESVSKNHFSIMSRGNSVSRRTTSTTWCPGRATSQLFDTEPYSSVIHPKPYVPAPMRRFPTKTLFKDSNPDFVPYAAKLNRPFMLTGNQHFIERPPRTFYGHLKAQHDFFSKEKNETEQKNEKIVKNEKIDKIRQSSSNRR